MRGKNTSRAHSRMMQVIPECMGEGLSAGHPLLKKKKKKKFTSFCHLPFATLELMQFEHLPFVHLPFRVFWQFAGCGVLWKSIVRIRGSQFIRAKMTKEGDKKAYVGHDHGSSVEGTDSRVPTSEKQWRDMPKGARPKTKPSENKPEPEPETQKATGSIWASA